MSLISFMQVHPDHGPRIAPGWWTARHGETWPPEVIDACDAEFDQALAWEADR